ncbi:response regulator [Devosia sp.]|uniref:response regulator n=1 Tax=Devosia sp. TaxID=1871048 RepID=UPI003A8EAB07
MATRAGDEAPGLSILLIEDNASDRRLVEIAFGEASVDTPAAMQWAESLKDGLALLATESFDAILLDLGLPDTEGLGGLTALQAEHPKTPVIVLTGLSDFDVAKTALQQGAADFLDKGELEARALLRAIRYAMERKKQDLALRESQIRFRNFLLASPDGVLIIDQAGMIQLASTRAETMFGYDPDQLNGVALSALIPGQDITVGRRHVLTDETSQALDQTIHGVRKDGTSFPLEINLSPESDDHDAATIAAIRDISDRKAMENQLMQSQKMEAIGTLTGGMAHDFNNLLAVVIGNLDLVAEGNSLNAEDNELIEEALEASLRGADLTQRLLAFARRQPLQPTRIEVNELVDGLFRLARRTLGANIEVKFVPGNDVPSIMADAAQLEACLFNIMNNARDAMADGGELVIRTDARFLDADFASGGTDFKPGHYAMVEIRDTGSGMPPEVVDQIFEPFFTTKEPGKGTGLGLSLVYGFIKQSGGQVYVYSEVGVGTISRLYLPSASTPDHERKAEKSRQDAEQGGTETILAVEDNSGLRQVVARQVTGLGYRFLEAENGKKALQVLEKEQVDLVFTDVVMPGGMSGYDLAKQVTERWPHTKVVLTSGFTDPRQNVGTAPSTNPRLLVKPYRRHELARILREALDATD